MSEARHIFFSDLEFPSQYCGVLVRSSLQTGKLKEIAPPDLPDGYFLFTASDIPGDNSVEINGGETPVFAEDEVSYIGEPVGIIAGPDYETAAALADKTKVIIEDNREEAEVPRIEQTYQKGDCSIFFVQKDDSEISENAGNVENKNDEASAETEESESLVITDSSAEILPMEYFYFEHLGATVKCKKDNIEIYTASLWPFHVKKTVSTVLGLPLEKITVVATSPGESHDGKIWLPSLAAAQAAVASFLCKKPVKLIFSRNEEISYLPKTPPVKIKIKSASTPDGKIKAMETGIEINSGRGTPFINEITARMTAVSQGFYSMANSKTSVQFAKTNLPPMMPANDFGESNVFLALETHINLLSLNLGISPSEIRIANGVDATYSSIMEAVCKKSDFARKHTAYENLNKKRSGIKDGALRGIGLSLGYQASGFVSDWPEGIQYSVEITMETTGEVHIKSSSHSPSIKEIICTLAADFLDIDKSLVNFDDSENKDMLSGGPDILSSTVAIISPLVLKCCAALQRQRFRKPLPITVKKTYKPAKPLNSEDYANIQKSGMFASLSPAACVVELELNPLDWSIKTRGIWLACSAGKLLDRNAAETTLKKTAKEALAKLSCEAVKIEDGRFCGLSRFGCSNLNFVSVPEPEIYFLESKEMPCGIGNIAQNLLPSAYCSALMQITGKSEITAPAVPRDIYNCLAKAEDMES